MDMVVVVCVRVQACESAIENTKFTLTCSMGVHIVDADFGLPRTVVFSFHFFSLQADPVCNSLFSREC